MRRTTVTLILLTFMLLKVVSALGQYDTWRSNPDRERNPIFKTKTKTRTKTGTKAKTPKDTLRVRKNAIFGAAGMIPVAGGAATLYYERLISQPGGHKKGSQWIRVGFGTWGVFYGGSGSLFTVSFTGLTGTKNHHFEYNAGLISYFNREEYDLAYGSSNPPRGNYTGVIPAAGIGYRYQKPSGSFVFRTGFSIPEALYISLGFTF